MNEEQYKQLVEVLQEMRDDEKKEMKYAKRQARFSVIISALCLVLVAVMVVVILTIIPKVVTVIDTATEISENVVVILDDAGAVIKNLDKVTTELNEMDINGLFDNVNTLVAQSQESITNTMKKIEDIDFVGLNQAISDLGDIVEPMAKFFR